MAAYGQSRSMYLSSDTFYRRCPLALGSLHACSILRKIRILIALAGSVPLSGYPLEMTLHAMQPLLTDQQCSEDASGIVQYLLEHGLDWLTSRLSFVCGFTVSTLISLQRFVGPSQPNGSLESANQSSSRETQDLRDWMFSTWCLRHISRVQERQPDDKRITPFQSMVQAAYEAGSLANSMEATPESRLIETLLEDQRGGTKLMSEPAQKLVFGLALF